MTREVDTPDGKWRLTNEGWIFLDSNPKQTPDGEWSLQDDEFVQDKQNQNTNEVKQDLRDSIFMEGIETDSPIGDIRDSVLMGDINVNINNSIDPEYISNVIKNTLEDMGIGLNYMSNNISSNEKLRISETIQTYDAKSRSGLEFDPETEFLIANASRAAGEFSDAIARFNRFIVSYPDHKLVPEAWLCLSKIHIRKRDFDSTERELENATNLFADLANWSGMANSIMTRGALEAERDQLNVAEKYFKNAIEFSKEKNILGIEIRAMTNLGILYWQTKDFIEAKSVLREALVHARSSNDVESVRRIEATLSKINVEDNSGNPNRNYRVNSDLLGDEFSRIDADYDEARIHHSRGNFSMAREGYQSCIERYQKIESWRNIGEVYSSLGQLHEDCEQYSDAVDSYEKGAEAFQNADDSEGLVHMRINLGGCLMMERKFEESIAYNIETFELAKNMNLYQGMVDLLVNIGISRSNLGFSDAARVDFEEARKLSRSFSVDGSSIPNY